MAFNVDTFRTNLGDGGARPNQFQVILGRGMEQISPFLVTAASLPGQTIGTASIFYRGREVKIAGDRVYSPWTTTIINDSDLSLRTWIEQWMANIENLQTKAGALLPADYFADLTVEQLDKTSNVRKRYILRGAWPTDISEVPLSFDANDQISAFSCTWQYQDFIIQGVSGGPQNMASMGYISGSGVDLKNAFGETTGDGSSSMNSDIVAPGG